MEKQNENDWAIKKESMTDSDVSYPGSVALDEPFFLRVTSGGQMEHQIAGTCQGDATQMAGEGSLRC